MTGIGAPVLASARDRGVGAPCDVLIFVEHLDRELRIVSAVANLLERRHGLRTELRSLIFDSLSSSFALRPRVVVTPSLSFGKGSAASLFWSVYGDRIGYVNMNWEQFISRSSIALKSPKHPASKKHQVQLVWEQGFGELLIEAGVPPANICRTGRPTAALMRRFYVPDRPRLRRDLAQALGFREDQPIVLVGLTTKFPSPRHQRSFVSSGADAALMNEGLDYLVGLARDVVRWMPATAAAFPEVSFVVRPHPSVGNDRWFDMFASQGLAVPRNVLISKAGDAYEWLSAADAVITEISTLCVEASAIGRYTVLVERENVPDHLRLSWLRGDAVVRSEHELIETLRRGLARPPGSVSHCEPGDGIEDTAEAIAMVAKRHASPPKPRLGERLAAFWQDPVRGAGSILRSWAMRRTGGWPFVPEGLRPDYLTPDRARSARESLLRAYGGA